MARSWLTSLTKPGPIQSFDDINVTKRPTNSENLTEKQWMPRQPLLMFSRKRSKQIQLGTLQNKWEARKSEFLAIGTKPIFDSQQVRSVDPQRTRWPQPPQLLVSQKRLMFSGKRPGRCPSPAIEGDRAALTSRLMPQHDAPNVDTDEPTKKDVKKTLAGASRKLMVVINPRAAIFGRLSKSSPVPEELPLPVEPVVESTILESSIETCAKDAVVQFTVVEESVLHRYFTIRDVDDSGSLSFEELMNVLDDIGRMPAEDSEYRPLLIQLRHEYDDDGSGELDFKEFLKFIGAYYKAVYRHIFRKHDVEGDAVVNRQELEVMLQDLNSAGFVAQGDQLGKMLRLVDSDMDDLVDFGEFCELMKHYRILEFGQLKKNAGFSAEEMTAYARAFECCDMDGSGTIEIKEVTTLFLEIGKPVHDIDRFVALFSRMDSDGTASLDFEEFVRLLKVWDKERVRAKVLTSDDNHENHENHEHLHKKRAARIAHLADTSLTKKETTSILESTAVATDVEDGVFATHWHLPLVEVRALRESFEFCDTDASGVIDSNEELIAVLSCMGIATKSNLQQKVLDQWRKQSAEKGRNLNFHGVVRFYSQYASALSREIFQSMQSVGGCLSLVQVITSLYQVGQYLSKAQVLSALQEVQSESMEHVDEATFTKILRYYQSETLLKWIRTYGFSDADIERFVKVFREWSHFADELPMDSVMGVVDALGFAPTQPERRDRAMSALTRVDRSGRGFVTFHDLLLLLRHLKNQALLEVYWQENKAAEEIGLDADSIVVLRKMFRSYSEDDTLRVPKSKIKQLLIGDLEIVSSSMQREQLNVAVKEYGSFITFLQFLQLMNSLDQTGAF